MEQVISIILVLMNVLICPTSAPSVPETIDKERYDTVPKSKMSDMFHVTSDGDPTMLTEMDMMLTPDQYKALHMPQNRAKRAAIRDAAAKWTDCTVYYEIDDALKFSYGDSGERAIREAIAEFEKYTCLRFYENTTASSRIQFLDGRGCFAQVGMLPPEFQPQKIVLGRGCRYKGLVLHEIGHAIGWRHEHNRPDRDQYIDISYDDIPIERWHAYLKYEPEAVDTYGTPYDYTSIMHYPENEWEWDWKEGSGKAITALDSEYQDRMGQQVGLSFKDIKLANVMYNCSGVMGCPHQDCDHDGFVFYRNHSGKGRCMCWCDSGDLDDPLVLCSELRHPPPAPNPRPRAVFTCRDTMKCHKILCPLRWGTFCKATCNHCIEGRHCQDHARACRYATRACTLPAWTEMMNKTCPVSCRLCRYDSGWGW